jgi:hypothetical protein
LLALQSLRLVALSSLFFCVRAFAQFEVAPDHFDSGTPRNRVMRTAKTERATKARLVASVVVKATSPDRQNGGHSATRAAQALHHGKDAQQRLSNQAVAVRRKKRDKEQVVAASR